MPSKRECNCHAAEMSRCSMASLEPCALFCLVGGLIYLLIEDPNNKGRLQSNTSIIRGGVEFHVLRAMLATFSSFLLVKLTVTTFLD